MGAEEEAVEDVQALLVGVAFGPGLGVAGAEEFGNGNAGDGAGRGLWKVVEARPAAKGLGIGDGFGR